MKQKQANQCVSSYEVIAVYPENAPTLEDLMNTTEFKEMVKKMMIEQRLKENEAKHT